MAKCTVTHPSQYTHPSEYIHLQTGNLFGLAVSIPHVYPGWGCLGQAPSEAVGPGVSGWLWVGHKFLVYSGGEK